jgi:hypothetical protein
MVIAEARGGWAVAVDTDRAHDDADAQDDDLSDSAMPSCVRRIATDNLANSIAPVALLQDFAMITVQKSAEQIISDLSREGAAAGPIHTARRGVARPGHPDPQCAPKFRKFCHTS